MEFTIFSFGLIMGLVMDLSINKLNTGIKLKENRKVQPKINYMINFTKLRPSSFYFIVRKSYLRLRKANILVVFITAAIIMISYLKFSLNIIFLKAVALDCILIIVAFVDIKNNIIPDKIAIIGLGIGLLFFLTGDISIKSKIFGMAAGGGILFLLALIPGAIGGGDIKLMFVLGEYLGVSRTIAAIFIAFILTSIVSIILLFLKLKTPKDYIPLGPFLATGSFLTFHFFNY
jgi:leader peptidase (prepilin peptidase) / N-methyltransferase